MITKSLKILIVDDHDVIVYAAKQAIREVYEDAVVESSESFPAAIRKVSQSPSYDLLILDVAIPGTEYYNMIGAFRKLQPKLRILIFSGLDEEKHAIHFLTAGANGFLSKLASFEQIKLSMEIVLRGDVYISAEVQKTMIVRFSKKDGLEKIQPTHALSPREVEIMDLLLAGKGAKEIASELRLKITTVSTHKARIFQKMDVLNLIDLFKKVKSETVK